MPSFLLISSSESLGLCVAGQAGQGCEEGHHGIPGVLGGEGCKGGYEKFDGAEKTGG